MSRPLQIFLGHCFADYKVNSHGQPDTAGISNLEIGTWFRNEIAQIGGARVEVVTTANPLTRPISDQVKRAIEESDAAIFVFPKRVCCPFQGWTTSQYVVSESGYAAARFRPDPEKRLFGFYEDGVNRETLGLAFPLDRTIPVFHRDKIDETRSTLSKVVQVIIQHTQPVSNDPEPLLLRKIVRVRRDGRVIIETTYRFRIRRESNRFHMRHTLWRVRSPFPSLSALLEAVPGDDRDYLICLPSAFGSGPLTNIQPKIDDVQRAPHGKETGFRLEMSGNPLQAGDIVDYQFEYSYGGAFFDPADLEPWEVNSTGLRTGGRGAVQKAVLIVSFERNWKGGEELPSIDLDDDQTGPLVTTAKETSIPGLMDSKEYWHRRKDVWHPASCMELCRDNPSPRWESYIWRSENFSGLAKATWRPAFNYHQAGQGTTGTQSPTPKDDGLTSE